MATYRFTVDRIDVQITHPFEEAEALLEKNVPVSDAGIFRQLVEARARADDVKAAVARSQGDLEFLILAKLAQGSLTSLLGTPKKLTVYLIGNPVIANRMFEQHRGAGLYAPIRASLYEDPLGAVHFAYDQPSTLLRSFGNAEIDTVAALLDEKMAALSSRLAQ
jgi:hypothetical protein